MVALGLLGLGCGAEAPAGGEAPDAGAPAYRCDPAATPTRTISCIDDFSPGAGAGFGQDRLPDIVYGAPLGGGSTGGSLDVLSLGHGGTIVFGFGGNAIVDGEGPDLLIFENAFYVGGNPDVVYQELAEVSVSADGVDWKTFPCEKDQKPPLGCAGWHPVYANEDLGISAFDPAVAGGDPFDLADVGLTEARLVRIHDLESPGGAPSAGFDLDAAALVHPKVP